MRVAGPFTVESLSPHRAFDDDAVVPASQSEVAEESSTSFERMLLENLRRAGVQNGRRAERFEFDEVERVPGRYVAARAVPRGDLADERVAISIGPRYGQSAPTGSRLPPGRRCAEPGTTCCSCWGRI